MSDLTVVVPGRCGCWPILPNPDAFPSLLKFQNVGLQGDKERKTHVVYFIYCAGFVKIGTTRILHKRLSTLQMGAPWQTRIVSLLAGGRITEDYLHSVFRELSIGGEWFRLGPDLRQAIIETAPEPLRGHLEEEEADYKEWIREEAERLGFLPVANQ